MYRGLVGTIVAVMLVLVVLSRIGVLVLPRVRAARRMRTLCTFCERPTQQDVDLYDDVHRRWCHASCRQRFLDAPLLERTEHPQNGAQLSRRQAC